MPQSRVGGETAVLIDFPALGGCLSLPSTKGGPKGAFPNKGEWPWKGWVPTRTEAGSAVAVADVVTGGWRKQERVLPGTGIFAKVGEDLSL